MHIIPDFSLLCLYFRIVIEYQIVIQMFNNKKN